MRELKIDPELRDLLPPLSDEEKKIMSGLIQEGVYVYIQKLPQNSQVDVSTKL